MALKLATTVGQKIGIDAQMIAKSTSKQEKIRVSGYHHVKSQPCKGSPLCLKVLHRRRTAISTTSEPMENNPVMAKISFFLSPGLMNSLSGIKKITMSKNILVAAKEKRVALVSSKVR